MIAEVSSLVTRESGDETEFERSELIALIPYYELREKKTQLFYRSISLKYIYNNLGRVNNRICNSFLTNILTANNLTTVANKNIILIKKEAVIKQKVSRM